MTPAGYLYKKVEKKPEGYNCDIVEDIYSVAGCISEDFTDYINYWKHNKYWLFDAPEIMEHIAETENIDLSVHTLFYYEIHDLEYREQETKWFEFTPELSFETNIKILENKSIQGYDVVSFSGHSSPECSPLSCNLLAATIPTNKHCLFSTFKEAKLALENNLFDKCEPGPYRIFAVYKFY